MVPALAHCLNASTRGIHCLWSARPPSGRAPVPWCREAPMSVQSPPLHMTKYCRFSGSERKPQIEDNIN